MTKQTKSIPIRQEQVSDASIARDANDPYLVTLTWTTGFKGLRNDAGGKYFEELSVTDVACDLSRLKNKAPVLANHDLTKLSSQIGVVEKAWIQGGIGKATIRLSRRPDVAGTVQDIMDGILRNVSVGYQISQMSETTAPGDKIPTYMATKWQPYEISIVSVPFDPMAQTQRSASETQVSEVEFLTRNQEASMSTTDNEAPAPAESVHAETAPVADVTPALEGERAATAAAAAAEKKPLAPKSKDKGPDDEDDEDDAGARSATDPDDDGDDDTMPAAAAKAPPAPKAKAKSGRSAAILEERTRALDISKAVKAAGLSADVASEMVARGISMAEASTEIFETLEKTQTKTSGVNRNKETKMENNVRSLIESAMLNRISPAHTLPAEAIAFKGQSLLRAFEALTPREVGEGNASYATRVMTTSDLPQLLANIANKQLRISYDEQKPTYADWCKIGTQPDFKPAKLVQTSVFPALQAVGEGANYPASSMSDQAESVQLSSFGVVLSFSRQMLMNDDLSALASFSTRAAAAAQRNVEKIAYAQLTGNPNMADGNPLFSTTRGPSGNTPASGSAISITSLSAAKAAMRFQTDPTGAPLNLVPSYLIVGPNKEVEAMQYVNNTFTPNQSSTINPFAGTLKVIVSAQIPGNKWYLAADKTLIDTVGVYFLEGMEAPQVQSRQNFENGATDIKVIHDVAALPLDYRGIWYNPGN